jgi:hypothetical protein
MKKLLILFLSFCSSTWAANVYVRDGGTGTGSSWSDALDQIPTTVRGNTYYVADGTYTGFVINTSVSGTSQIIIKKATIADHGTATGWSDTYGDGVATFTTGIDINRGYVVLDGAYEYGFALTANDGDNAISMMNSTGVDQDGIQIKYCDMNGTHTMPHNFTNAQECRSIYVHQWSGSAYANMLNLLISHCKMHGVSTMMQVSYCQDMVIEYCKIYDNRVVDASYDPGTMAHPNMLFLEWSYRTTFRYNEIYDCVAQGFYPAYGGSGYYLYGNYWHDIVGFAIFFYDPGTYSNARIYNNTFVRTNWSMIWDNNNLSDAVAQNNIFYQYSDGPNYGNFTHNFNWYTGSGASTFSEANGVNGGSNNPFTTAPGIVSTISSVMPRGKGATLASPYNVDMLGTVRGADGSWDIGAIEYNAGDVTAPTPDPMTFSVSPTAVDAFSVTMTASTASDASGTVDGYFFTETTGQTGGTASGWQSATNYVDTGLSPSTTYTYTVKSRDNSFNETANSTALSVTTPASGGGGASTAIPLTLPLFELDHELPLPCRQRSPLLGSSHRGFLLQPLHGDQEYEGWHGGNQDLQDHHPLLHRAVLNRGDQVLLLRKNLLSLRHGLGKLERDSLHREVRCPGPSISSRKASSG